ncbi:tetratricopeptide [Diaporthe helianthi]|uniref:Tetratricopeptide n=1 Tax=Diaporthe helianthi TaxID=158607 RepID=A0A2P5HS66_DIAHE|nr:tetratricopeptide [Diaporthe helianthi]
MSEDTRTRVLQHLGLWSEPLDDLYRPENMRRVVGTALLEGSMRRMVNGLMNRGEIPDTCEEDDETFSESTIISPPKTFIQRHEPRIGPILERTRSEKDSEATLEQAGRDLDAYINQHWKTNLTMIDLVWAACYRLGSSLLKGLRHQDVLLLDATGCS